MADKTSLTDTSPRSSTKQKEYLSAFQSLGPQIYFYIPTLEKHTPEELKESESEPDLIIMCTWMAASARHIEKYTNQYLKQYNSVPMLLIRSSELDVLFKRERHQVDELEPAIAAIRAISAGLDRPPKVLLHIFSNGGSWSATMLSRAYEKTTGGSLLPISALVLDSCPSLPRIELSHLALATVLPRSLLLYYIGSMLLWVYLYVIRVFNQFHVTDNLILTIRQVLNEPLGPFINSGIPRVYICSQADAMVPIQDVESHAEEARKTMTQIGVQEEDVKNRVSLERFEGTPHVGHLKKDPERYWAIVKTVWERAMSLESIEAAKAT